MADEDNKAAGDQAPEQPEASEKADAAEPAKAPDKAAAPEASEPAKAPKQPEAPEKAEAAEPAKAPEKADAAKAPEKADAPEASEKAEAAKAPEKADVAEASEKAKAPEPLKAPEKADASEPAKAPKQPEASGKAAPPEPAKAPKRPEASGATAGAGEAKPDGGAGNGKTRTLTDLADLGAVTGVTAAAPPPEPEMPAPKIDAQGRAYATGKRKDAIARVWIKPGSGRITVNGRDWETYFARPVLRMIIDQPLVAAKRKDQYDIWCTVKGGGLSGQAGAVRYGLSKALTSFEPDLRRLLKTGGFLTRDARVVERKKYGRHKARRSHQFSKR